MSNNEIATEDDPTEAGIPVETELPPLPEPGSSRRARRRRVNAWTVSLLIALGTAAGFFAGVEIQKGQAGATAASGSGTGSSFGLGFRGGARSGATGSGATGGAGGAGGGGATFGQIKLVDGDNVYVTDAQGNVVKVSTTGAQITASKPGTVADLKPGETVVVRGQADKQGTIKATSVSTGGAAAGFGGRGG
jgi:hypothetical protein